jgi:hypothetical protein
MRMVRAPPIYGRFHKVDDLCHNYLRAVDIMARVDGPNWHNKSFHDLEDKDFIWGMSCVASKRMGLHCGAHVDEYPLFNRLVYMALNNAQSEYPWLLSDGQFVDFPSQVPTGCCGLPS